MSARRDRVAVVVEDRRPRRWPRRLGIGIAAALVLFHALGGWYFSGQIRSDALLVTESEPDFAHTVTGVSAESVTFALPARPEADLVSSEVLGLRWDGGYGLTGPVLAESDDAIAKQFTLLTGALPEPGSRAAFDGFATPDDPADAGIVYETVTYRSEFGDFEAWLAGDPGGTWAIFVHGRGASPREGIRILPVFLDRGITSLLIEYRNDPGAPATPDRLATFGVTEWEDLEGAVSFAVDRGASRVILVGFSMGGAIAMSFLAESDLAPLVAGVVLDSPALELGAMVDARAGETNLPLVPLRVPVTLTAVSKWMAGLRFGTSWGAMDYLDGRADALETPTLLLHGTADGTVPIALSRELADRRPDIVELVEFPGAEHVRGWNVDADRYEQAVASFLDGLGL